jgi:hypothetical protein
MEVEVWLLDMETLIGAVAARDGGPGTWHKWTFGRNAVLERLAVLWRAMVIFVFG